MAYKNLRETCYFKTGREGVVLEFLDEVHPNLFDFNKSIENSILKKYSKFKVTLVDSRKTSGAGNAVYYNLGSDEALLLSYLLSDGNGDSFKKRVGAFNSMSQTGQIFIRNIIETFDKIDIPRFDRLMDYESAKDGTSVTFQKNINTSKDDLLIRKFTLSYEEAMRSASKWKITIEVGTGKKDVNKGNGLNIIMPKTFKSTAKSFLMLQVEEVVIPLNEAASRVMAAKQAFYPLMKAAEVDFTRRKMEAKDYEGDRIDEWNPQGKSTFAPRDNSSDEKEEVGTVQEDVKEEVKEEVKAVEKKEPKKETKKEAPKVAAEAPKTEQKVCSDCGVDVTDKVYDYSTKQFKKPLCFSCQKKAKANAS